MSCLFPRFVYKFPIFMLFSLKLFLSLCVDSTYTKFKVKKVKHTVKTSHPWCHSHRLPLHAGTCVLPPFLWAAFCTQVHQCMCFPFFSSAADCIVRCCVSSFPLDSVFLRLSPDRVISAALVPLGGGAMGSIVIINHLPAEGRWRCFPSAVINTASSHSW